jgi:hypothetical protein
MPSRNVGPKRQRTGDPEIPAEMAQREAQDRPRNRESAHQAESPVDSMHVDAPKRRGNAAGAKRKKP